MKDIENNVLMDSILMGSLDRYAVEAVDLVKSQTCNTCVFKKNSCQDEPCDIAAYLIVYFETYLAGKNAQWN